VSATSKRNITRRRPYNHRYTDRRSAESPARRGRAPGRSAAARGLQQQALLGGRHQPAGTNYDVDADRYRVYTCTHEEIVEAFFTGSAQSA
jgi:hypothetical protein